MSSVTADNVKKKLAIAKLLLAVIESFPAQEGLLGRYRFDQVVVSPIALAGLRIRQVEGHEHLDQALSRVHLIVGMVDAGEKVIHAVNVLQPTMRDFTAAFLVTFLFDCLPYVLTHGDELGWTSSLLGLALEASEDDGLNPIQHHVRTSAHEWLVGVILDADDPNPHGWI